MNIWQESNIHSWQKLSTWGVAGNALVLTKGICENPTADITPDAPLDQKEGIMSSEMWHVVTYINADEPGKERRTGTPKPVKLRQEFKKRPR